MPFLQPETITEAHSKHNVFVHKTKNNRNGIKNACTEQKNDTSYIDKNKHIKKGCAIMNNINANTIGQFFQDIISKFSDMNPTNIDALENKVLDAIYKLGSLLME